MNHHLISMLSDLVFMERKKLFSHADVVLYHPGHFPELNLLIRDLYRDEGFEKIMIPSIHNVFLDANEHDFHKKILLEYGIPHFKINPILGEQNTARDVVRNAMAGITPQDQTVLLAGKAFFCRRFQLMAAVDAHPNLVMDVFPMEDGRSINRTNWYESEQGTKRVLNEVRQYASIIENLGRK